MPSPCPGTASSCCRSSHGRDHRSMPSMTRQDGHASMYPLHGLATLAPFLVAACAWSWVHWRGCGACPVPKLKGALQMLHTRLPVPAFVAAFHCVCGAQVRVQQHCAPPRRGPDLRTYKRLASRHQAPGTRPPHAAPSTKGSRWCTARPASAGLFLCSPARLAHHTPSRIKPTTFCTGRCNHNPGCQAAFSRFFIRVL